MLFYIIYIIYFFNIKKVFLNNYYKIIKNIAKEVIINKGQE